MTAEAPYPALTVIGVTRRAVGLYWQNFLVPTILAAIFLVPGNVFHVVPELADFGPSTENGLRIVGSIVDFCLYCVVYGGLTYGFLRAHRRQAPGYKEYLAVGFEIGGKVIKTGVLGALLILVGLLLFIVPGIFLYAIFFISPAIIVQERLGAVATLKRSIELTRGRRVVVFVILLASIAAMAIAVSPIYLVAIPADLFIVEGKDAVFTHLAVFLAAPILTCVSAAFAAVLYSSLVPQENEISPVMD